MAKPLYKMTKQQQYDYHMKRYDALLKQARFEISCKDERASYHTFSRAMNAKDKASVLAESRYVKPRS